MTRMMKALGAKRAELEQKKANDEGFTLIELLVVVIIIGILAAIAIPIYINVQNSATDSAVQSDLNNAKTALVAYFTSNGSYPTGTDLAGLEDFGYDNTGGSVDYTQAGAVAPALDAAATAAGGFCIEATSPTSTVFHVDETSGVKTGACA
ncbi:MAG TPA: prepilin-type N-terminal cleavage/methylation domain-containing protein [Protaetiibacter sp.]|nr:prepilin-type N-terminal cleavage/methylation domain-containing protein [Protaetiibacter sp.]